MKKRRLLIAFIVISFVFLMLAFVSALTPPAPSITVLSPNGGEVWQIGTTQTIKWNSDLVSIPEQPIIYDISLVPYCPSGQICTTLVAPFVIAKNVSDLTYNWKVGNLIDSSAPEGSYNIKICQSGTSTCDSSDSYFKITIVISCKMPACEGVYDTGKKDENGCVIYACPTNQTLSCTDSDGGINYYVKGNVLASRGVGFDGTIYDHNPPAIFLDSCFKTVSAPVEESDKVLENYCQEGIRKYTIYSCPNGCKDGACIQITNATGCSMPICGGKYDTGKKDENGCVIYACPSEIVCKSGQKIGDLNGDGAINSHDYSIADTTLRKIILGSLPKPKEICCADANQDGTLTTADIAKINAIAQGLAQSPGACPIRPELRCEDYSYNECPSGCEKKTTICAKCSEGSEGNPPTCPTIVCPLICVTPGQKEVYLNQKFELKSQETAKVVDYKNMEIKYVGMLCTSSSCRENEPCPPTPNPCKLHLQVSISSSGGTGTTTGSTKDPAPPSLATTSATSTSSTSGGGSGGGGGVGTVFDLAPGEKKEVFGASISLLRLERDIAVLVVEERIIIKPVCGNGICEVGEGEICTVPASSSEISCEEGKECKTPPSKCNLVCPQDCSKYETISIPLGEKFKLQISQTGNVKEENLKITFKNMIASRCKEEVVSSKASAVAIKEKVAEAERTLTGSVVSDLSTDKPVSVLRCVGSGPRALLSFEIERIKGNPIKKGVLELDLSEKKQIGDFTLAFLDYDYASRTGVFLVDKEKFICPARCKCDTEGNSIDCQDKKICEEGKILCQDGECRDKCEIKPSEEECNFGCNYEGSCFPMGVRSKGLYCGTDSVMNSQKDNEQICENNFECSSNVCISGKCISKGFVDKILDFFRRIFGAG